MNPDKRPISVEDLLQLKRAERPAPEFWAQFDQQLRAKQLAALVAKKPWWQRIQFPSVSWRRLQVPVGAAAVLALALVTFRESDLSDAPSPDVQELAHPAPTIVVAAAGTAALPESIASADTVRVVPVSMIDSAGVVEAPLPGTDASVAVAGYADQLPLLGSTSVDDGNPANSVTPSARYIAANLAAIHVEPVADRLIGATQGFESRAMPARNAVIDPLQQMAPPGEARRARFTAMVSNAVVETSEQPTARVANRISGEELYEQVSRFGTRRGGFNMKF